MKPKSYIAVMVLLVAALVVARVAAAGPPPPPVPPTITVLNNGGAGKVPTKGTGKCEFTAVSQICKIAVTNTSAFDVTITKSELVLKEAGRYEIVPLSSTCLVGDELGAKGGVCTLEVERKKAAGACKEFDNYVVEVEEKGNPANHVQGSAVLEMT